MSDSREPRGAPSSGTPYDPERFWDAKAVRSGGDLIRAACTDDAEMNRCIDRVQRHLLAVAMRFVGRRVELHEAALLDFGCGSGRWTTFFNGLGCCYSGIDISKEMLRIARAQCPEASYAVIEDGKIPFPDRSFDIACSIAVIHHSPYDRQQQMAVELSRVVREGGHLVLFESVGPRAPEGAIEYPRSVEDWRSLFADLGLTLGLYRGARYGILRWAAAKLVRKLRVGAQTDGRTWRTGVAKPWWQRRFDRLDIAVDPTLSRILPARYHRRALMVFRMGASQGRTNADSAQSGSTS